MRKTIKNSETELAPEKTSWLDVRTIARVEVTSEDWRYPIESAFDETDERAELPHAELPQHVGALVPTTPDEQCLTQAIGTHCWTCFAV